MKIFMTRTNTQVLEADLNRLRGPHYNPPLTTDEIVKSLRVLCNNTIAAADIEKFLKDKGLIT